MRSRIDVAPTLRNVAYSAHVRVPDDHVQPPVPLGVGEGLVAGVDDRPAAGRRRRHALPDVLGPLGDAEHRPRSSQHLARPGVDLPRHEERDQHLGVVADVVTPRGHVVLVAAVGVPGRVRVVLEQVDAAPDARLAQLLRRRNQELLEDPLTGLVMGDQVEDRVALRRGVLGVTAHVEVQASPVGEEHVARTAPRHHPAEHVARHLVGAEAPLPPQGERDPVLVLEPEDPPLHDRNLPPPTALSEADFFGDLLASGAGPASVAKAYRVLRAIMTTALDDETGAPEPVPDQGRRQGQPSRTAGGIGRAGFRGGGQDRPVGFGAWSCWRRSPAFDGASWGCCAATTWTSLAVSESRPRRPRSAACCWTTTPRSPRRARGGGRPGRRSVRRSCGLGSAARTDMGWRRRTLLRRMSAPPVPAASSTRRPHGSSPLPGARPRWRACLVEEDGRLGGRFRFRGGRGWPGLDGLR